MGDDSDEEKKGASGSDSEEDEDRWAAGHYHVSRRAPGEADSEDEEALELEAEEARRLQKKGAEKLRGEDYGLGAEDDQEEGGDKLAEERMLDLEGENEGEGKDEEESKIDTKSLNEEESIAHLLKYSPETLALVDDFVRTASKIKDVEGDLDNVRKVGDGKGGEHPGLAIMELEHRELILFVSMRPLLTYFDSCRGTFDLSPNSSILFLTPPFPYPSTFFPPHESTQSYLIPSTIPRNYGRTRSHYRFVRRWIRQRRFRSRRRGIR